MLSKQSHLESTSQNVHAVSKRSNESSFCVLVPFLVGQTLVFTSYLHCPLSCLLLVFAARKGADLIELHNACTDYRGFGATINMRLLPCKDTYVHTFPPSTGMTISAGFPSIMDTRQHTKSGVHACVHVHCVQHTVWQCGSGGSWCCMYM